jgi:vancomycin resistance protein YoaR
MAQTPLSQQLAGPLSDGLGVIASPRSWPPAVRSWLRDNLLPVDTQHDPARLARPAHVASHPRLRFARMLPSVIIALVSVLLAAAIALLIFRAIYSDRIYPAVVVGDVRVGGLTTSEAQAELTARAADLEQGTIAFTYNGMTWTPALADLGATVDVEESIDVAGRLGRGGDASSRLAFTGAILRSDQVVPLRTQVDMAILNAWFDRVDRQIDNPAVNAQIVVEGSSVSISPDATGIVIDRQAATTQILSTLTTLEPMRAELPVMVDLPEITVSDLEQVKSDVQTAIAKPVRIGFENQTWRIESVTLSSYLIVETVLEGGKPTAKLSIDTERLARDLRTQFVPEVNREPVDARIAWNDERGRIVALEPSETGVTLKATAFAEAVAASYLGDHGTVKIPVVITRPDIDDDNLDALGITELLGSGDSNFAYGVPGRDENVRLAAEYMNGTLVPPGGEFSYNGAIGEITAERGFQDALVVQGEGVGRDVGGGVCQVSTTIFRAALYAGMPITEWYQHTFRLPNYEYDGWAPGFDASILQVGSNPENWADFRFENYTDNWLFVESYIAYPNVYVNIYGTGDGRTVDFSTYELGKNAFGFSRVIYDAKGEVIAERSFASYFL